MMSPAGWKHGEIVHRLHVILGRYIEDHRLGKGFGAETGFLLFSEPDTVRAPDFAFIANENLPAIRPADAYWPGAPDLAVEVLSPHDKTGEVDQKIEDWLKGGTKLLWVVDPQLQMVIVYRSLIDVTLKTIADVLDGGDVLRGFSCAVFDIFPPQ